MCSAFIGDPIQEEHLLQHSLLAVIEAIWVAALRFDKALPVLPNSPLFFRLSQELFDVFGEHSNILQTD